MFDDGIIIRDAQPDISISSYVFSFSPGTRHSTQALSESPQLRRAAGAAATAVSAAAGTARVQFTYTSRTIGKVRPLEPV